MTYYQGGKKRLGKEISEIIHEFSTIYENKNGIKFKGYCEPFCGMLGVYKHIPVMFESHKPHLKFIASDRNEDLILLLKSIKRGWKPPNSCSKKEYLRLKKSLKKSPKKSFCGFAASMRGVYFGGYFDINNIDHQRNELIDIGRRVQDVSFFTGDYTKNSNLKNYIIYCDPPYEGHQHNYASEKHYTKSNFFDSKMFFDWCRKMSVNNLVFVSEYKAPKDFKLIWREGKEKLFLV